MKLALVCSSGGHLLELHFLKDFWSAYERFWVTFPAKEVPHLLSDEKIHFAYHPTNRHIPNFVRNCFLAFKILRSEKPDLILSTGAGIGVPFIYVGRLLGIKTVFLETITRSKNLSLSGKLVYPVVQEFLAQWPELSERYSKVQFKGRCV